MPSPRNLVGVLVLLVLGGVAVRSAAPILADPALIPSLDFSEYWCAGTLNLAGRDPYDKTAMYDLQRGTDSDIGQAIMMWNPPWTLTLVMPLAWLPWHPAKLAWLGVRLLALAAAAHLFGRVYRRPAAGWAVVFTWLPCYVALQYGQIPPLMLLGVALFLSLERRGHRFAAGFACVLLAVKPHLALLFWLAVGLHAVREREWRIVAGGLAGGAVLSAWPLVQNPHVFAQYFASAGANPPSQWISPTIGSFLRLAFGTEQFWLQFVPVVPGLVWFAWHAARVRRPWDWAAETPGLIFVSLVAAPYGAWPYDLTMLVLPFVAAAARGPTRAAVAFYALLNAGMLACAVTGVAAHWWAWVAPTALAGYPLTARPRETA